MSSLDGLLSATGSVYLVNRNGVIVGRSGVVNVGGTFVASTLDMTDAGFLAGGPLGLAGASPAAVVNYGRIGALGGDVVLAAAQVANAGTSTAPKGDAGLLAGSSVLLTDASLDEGRFSVLVGGAGTSATNSGLIAAADAELRAEGGNVYALAGDTAGVIRATGISTGGGHVWLVADGGQLQVAGALDAQGAGGAPGAVETSGREVSLGAARVDAHGGTWRIDPVDLTIDQAAATTIDTALNAGTSVLEQTTATGYSGAGVATANGKSRGDITLAAPLSWSTNAALTLSAYHDIDVNAAIASTGGGAVTLYADNSGTGSGTVAFGSAGRVTTSGAVNIFYDYASNPAGSVVNATSYSNPTEYSGRVSGGDGGGLTSYMLVSTVYDLQNIQNDLVADYALGRDIDASMTRTWSSAGFIPIGAQGSPFSGALFGGNHAVSSLYINAPGAAEVGVFAESSGSISDLSLVGETVKGGAEHNAFIGGLVGVIDQGAVTNVTVQASISSTGGAEVGGIAGLSLGRLLNLSTSGTVSSCSSHGGESIGGLVGVNNGHISSSHSDVDLTGEGQQGGLIADAGGLVGLDQGRISNAYATGTVDSGGAGGFVGIDAGTISAAYASGRLPSSGDFIGGFAGSNEGGVISGSYYDRTTSGQPYAVPIDITAHQDRPRSPLSMARRLTRLPLTQLWT